MKFRILKYYDDTTGVEQVNVSQKVEYFVHYWNVIFSNQVVNFDPYYLKSHRTIIDKFKLQIEGNFEYSKRIIKYFFQDDCHFKSDNVIMKKIKNTKEKRAIKKLNDIIGLNNTQWNNTKPKKFHTQLKKIENWLNTDYPRLITECINEILEKDSPITQEDKVAIKQLVNYYIIELFNKGFNTKYIQGIPESLYDYKKFPYERIFSDFGDEKLYDAYKVSEWKTMTLKKQINGILRILNRPTRIHYVIFRVYDINWRHEPLKILGVEFYNPNTGFNPKINHRLPIKLFEETFTSQPESYEHSSQCNACVKVYGIQEDQLYNYAFAKVKLSLSILNREIETNGKIYIPNVFITSPNFDTIWGTTDALSRGLKAVDEVKDFQIERINYLEKLNPDIEEDKAVLNLISNISEVLTDDYYSPEKLWMILEATFGNEVQIKELFKSIYKIFLKYNFLIKSKKGLAYSINPEFSFTHPENEYELPVIDCNKLGINDDTEYYDLKKFTNKICKLKSKLDLPIIHDLIDNIEQFLNDKNNFFKRVDDYIEYMLKELYAQRNLTVHSNMSDDFFLLKKKEINSMMNIVIEIFLYNYLKVKERSISKTMSNIKKKALNI